LSTGIVCRDSGCARVAGNVILGNVGVDVVGLAVVGSGAAIQRNRISGGCPVRSASGLLAEDAWARIDDNLISGGSCSTPVPTASFESAGLHVHLADGPNEIDAHSNTIDGGGVPAVGCASMGVDYSLGNLPPPMEAKGLLRNNIIRAGVCGTRHGVAERDATCDPRVFENNDLDPAGPPSALYRDEDTTSLNSAAAVNALAGASGNLSADPMFTAYPNDLHLTAGSACVNAGTPDGAPAKDFDGKARDASKPDIGAYEL
jgi:hypothetical protein